VLSGTRQTTLPSVREKVLDKEGFADALCAEPFLPSATLGKTFADCFYSAKPSVPVVYQYIRKKIFLSTASASVIEIFLCSAGLQVTS
jgi:hypothetical protein